MILTEAQQNNLDVINRNLNESNSEHEMFMDAMEALLNDGVDVQQALYEIYGTELD